MSEKAVKIILTIVKLLLVCYVLTGGMLALLAFVMLKMSPPEQFVSGGILFAYVLSTFIGGMALGKKMGQKKYLWGIMFGVLYFAIIFAISLGMNGVVGEPIRSAVTVLMLCASGGMLGGMLG